MEIKHEQSIFFSKSSEEGENLFVFGPIKTSLSPPRDVGFIIIFETKKRKAS